MTKSGPDEKRDTASGWPADVESITFDETERLGIQRGTNALFWDGKEIVTKNMIRLGTRETRFAVAGLAIAFAGLVHEIGKTAHWW